jgi:hypothetical protein
MTAKKLQVFVSSTYTDMKAERQAAVEAILQAGHIPAGMELFAAGDKSQWETIKKWIDESDVYMLILAGRYGSIEHDTQKSYIQLEYEYAVARNKPMFAVVITQKGLDEKLRTMQSSAIDTANGAKLEDFKKAVTSNVCRFFEDLKDIKLAVLESLLQYASDDKLIGWVRGDQVVNAKETLEEMNKLSRENAELFTRLQQMQDAIALADENEESPSEKLSGDAQQLLLAAAAKNGDIMYIRFMGGAQLGVSGGKNFLAGGGPREEARWKAALQELEREGFVEGVGYKGEIWRVTHLGYQAAKALEQKEGHSREP